MRFKGLDVNLLVALDALLEELSVSKAAARLNITQSAMSAALNRLRDFFHDDILSLNGRQMMATAYAKSLGVQTKLILADLQTMVSTSSVFDPSTSERTFRITASDYLTIVLLTPLVTLLDKIAPGVKLELRLPSAATQSQLESGELDLIVLPEVFMMPHHPSEVVLEEEHVLVGWLDNPVFDRALTEADIADLKFVAVAFGSNSERTFAEMNMDKFRHRRKIDIYAPSFTAVPWLLVGTNRVALMHKRMAELFVTMMPLRYVPLPFPFPIMREMIQYHKTHALDSGLVWLRETILSIGRPNSFISDDIGNHDGE